MIEIDLHGHVTTEDLRTILDDLRQCYVGEGYDVLESAPEDVIEAYKRLRAFLDLVEPPKKRKHGHRSG